MHAATGIKLRLRQTVAGYTSFLPQLSRDRSSLVAWPGALTSSLGIHLTATLLKNGLDCDAIACGGRSGA